MNIYLSGINFKTAPIDIREQLSLEEEEKKSLLDTLKKEYKEAECVIVQTCNRSEFYIYTDDQSFEIEKFEEILCLQKSLDIYNFKKYFYSYEGINAVRHLFKVSCGLDSMVCGEDQILSQIKKAHISSLDLKASGGTLNTLFRYAITIAKKVKTKTGISKNSYSIGSLVSKLILKEFDTSISEKIALVIGIGEMGELVLKNLLTLGLKKVIVTNRNHNKAYELSKKHPTMECINYKDRYSYINDCHIVVSATKSPHYTITKDMVEKSIQNKDKRIFIDLAIPRDMDTALESLQNVEYFHIDSFKEISEQNNNKRLSEKIKAEEIIEIEVDDFEKWYNYRKALPIIMDIRNSTQNLLFEKFQKNFSKLKGVNESDIDLLKESIQGMVNAIVNKFVYSIRENAKADDMDGYLNCIREAFKES